MSKRSIVTGSLATRRSFYAEFVASHAGTRGRDPELVRAFAQVPRETFLGPGPWQVFTPQGYLQTPSADPALVYQDIVIALKSVDRINNGQPSLHARCLGSLQIRPGESVVHIGTGSGYYTAVIAELLDASGRLYGFEIDQELAERARENLRAYRTVTIFPRSGASGEMPQSDVIYVNAGATGPLDLWLDALRAGGRLLFPLTGAAGAGGMLLITQDEGDRFAARFVAPAMFIPCVGARDDTVAARLTEAFKRGDFRGVRSLCRNTSPDETCWCHGAHWWLSKTA
ncbi:MAG: protein-L-isoaspartate O-methyltransferase family protein [Gammaproteobacteria bacterium]